MLNKLKGMTDHGPKFVFDNDEDTASVQKLNGGYYFENGDYDHIEKTAEGMVAYLNKYHYTLVGVDK